MIAAPLPPLFEALLARAKQLYSLPAVAMEVLRLTGSDQVDLAALRGTIERDPALVARLLRAVNSPLFRVGQPVANLAQAMTLLGIQPLKLLVLSFSLPRNLCGGEGETLGIYWRRTLAKAIAARHIATAWLHGPPDEAFLAGLLQDLGVLVLLKELGAPYGRLLGGLMGRAGQLAGAETQLLGFPHTLLSARLLSQWGLPELLVSAVAMPAQCDMILSLKAPVRGLAMTLHLADLAAELAVAPQPETAGALCVVGRKYLGLKRDQLEPLLGCLAEELPSLAEMLRIDVGGAACEQVLAEAHERLAALQEDLLHHLPRGEAVEQQILEDATELTAAAERLARSIEAPRTTPGDLVERTAERLARDDRGVKPATARSDAAAAVAASPLAGRLAAMLAVSRAQRQPCSLLMAEADDPEGNDYLLEQAQETAWLAARCTFGGCGNVEEIVVPIGSRRIAVLLADHDRSAALELARAWQREFAAAHDPHLAQPPRLRIGAATVHVVSPNFPALEFILAATRCLSAAGHSHGVDLKSIEL